MKDFMKAKKKNNWKTKNFDFWFQRRYSQTTMLIWVVAAMLAGIKLALWPVWIALIVGFLWGLFEDALLKVNNARRGMCK